MPAMPPTSAVPPLRTLRRVTLVMHSSLGDAVRPIWRRLGVLFRLSRLRGSTPAHGFACATRCLDNHFWRSHGFGVGDNFSAKPGEFFASRRRDIAANQYGDAVDGLYWVGALQSAHDSYPPAQQWYAVAGRVFLVL